MSALERVTKGDRTRQAILSQALDLASEVGFEGLTIGSLAKQTGLSKSGLYAHFDSKEQLQCDVLDAAAAYFVDQVVAPSMKSPRGRARLQRLFELWLEWEEDCHSGGCPFVAATVEFDDRPGAVRERLQRHMHDLMDVIAGSVQVAIDEGQFAADTDAKRFAFDVWGILLAYQSFSRLLDQPDAVAQASRSFEALLEQAAA